MKYHVNPDTGKVSACRAKVKCRFGGKSGSENHFASKVAADTASETMLSSQYVTTTGQSKHDFATVRDNIQRGLVSSGIIPTAASLPAVSNRSEIIEKWFGGDRKKFDLIARISDPQASLTANTKRSVGRLVASGADVSVAGDSKFTNAPSGLTSDVELIGDLSDGEKTLEGITSGSLKAF